MTSNGKQNESGTIVRFFITVTPIPLHLPLSTFILMFLLIFHCEMWVYTLGDALTTGE